MNWTKVLIITVAGGVALWLFDFAMHGGLLAETYKNNTVAFTQEQSNPMSFLFIELAIAFTAALFFVKTRNSWADGPKGGATFGFFAGLLALFPPFMNSLVINGFPYYLGWCWGSINLIGLVIVGAIAGAIYKKAA